jgi:hypothetical protein
MREAKRAFLLGAVGLLMVPLMVLDPLPFYWSGLALRASGRDAGDGHPHGERTPSAQAACDPKPVAREKLGGLHGAGDAPRADHAEIAIQARRRWQ